LSHSVAQEPDTQTCPLAQAASHAPQWAGSFWVSTQRVPH
jgi:hypothetical protein